MTIFFQEEVISHQAEDCCDQQVPIVLNCDTNINSKSSKIEIDIKKEDPGSDPSTPTKKTLQEDNRSQILKRSINNVSISDEQDPLYWEKRRKNNESAKRSRETRRMKEEATRYTADLLFVEHQNLLREKATLMEEVSRLRQALAAYD